MTEKLSGFYEAEQDPERDTSMICLPDARVDVCLYLIEPHLLPEVDIDAIVAIGKLTPIFLLQAKVSQRASAGLVEPSWVLANLVKSCLFLNTIPGRASLCRSLDQAEMRKVRSFWGRRFNAGRKYA